MFSIYFLQPYGTTTVSPSNFTESNVARANERALKIVKKSTSAQHNVVSEARTDKANYDTTPISPRAPCPTLQGLLCYHPEGSASTARCNCSCAHSGQHQEEQRLTQAAAITGTGTEQNRGTNRSSPGRLPSTAVILACRALSSMCTVTPRTTTYEPLGSHNKAARGK